MKDINETLARGLHLLRLLNLHGAMSVAELVRRAGIPRSSVNRALETLIHEGYVSRDSMRRELRSTARVRDLSDGFNPESWAVELGAPMLHDLAGITRWPVYLFTYQSGEMVVKISTDDLSPLVVERYPAGSRVPLLSCSMGLVWLAYGSDSMRAALLAMPHVALPEDAALRTDPVAQQALWAQIRAQGWANRPLRDGKHLGLSVPVMLDGDVLAVVSTRFRPEAIPQAERAARLIGPMQMAAQRLGAAVHHRVRSSARPLRREAKRG